MKAASECNPRTRRRPWIVGVGASAGLGAALAHAYARHGLIVAPTGRTRDRVEAIADEIRQAGGRAHAIAGDVSDEADEARFATELGDMGPLRAAVFNAGNAVRGGLLDLTAQFGQTWRNGTLSGFLFARVAVQALLANGIDPQSARGRGSVIFTGATASLRGGARFAAFASSKAALGEARTRSSE